MVNSSRFDCQNVFKYQRAFARCRIFADRLHFKNHVDVWCKTYMDPATVPEAAGVNTQVRHLCRLQLCYRCGPEPQGGNRVHQQNLVGTSGCIPLCTLLQSVVMYSVNQTFSWVSNTLPHCEGGLLISLGIHELMSQQALLLSVEIMISPH